LHGLLGSISREGISLKPRRGTPAAAPPWRAALALVVCALLGACAYKPTVPPSQGHLDSERVPSRPPDEKILPPVRVTDFVPPPKPQVKLPTYSVVVHEVPVKDLLFALARDTKQNIDVHPGVQGLVSLNAIDETLPAILERVSQQVNVRYRNEGKTIVVMPDAPYFKTYRVNYVNVSRDTTASIGVSGDISGATSRATGGGQSSAGQSTGTSSTKVETTSKNNFWETLRANIESILAATKVLSESADQRAARAEALRASRQERIAQAEAAARAGPNAAPLFEKAFGTETLAKTEAKDEIIVNPVAGSVTVLGTEKQHALVQQYLDGVTSASQRQVLIEATIAEVRLSNEYQAGVDWSRIAAGTGFTLQQQLLGSNLGTAPRMVIGYANPTSSIGNISASLRLLEQFGNTRVLSSPKLMAINNQSALLKVVDNVVYFEIEAQTSQNQTSTLQTFNTTPQTVPVGLVMSVLPQITEGGVVNLTVRPTISRITRFVADPNPSLQVDSQGNALPNPIQNLIPEIQVREMESVLQVGSGQTVVLGGLMQDDVRRDRDAVPVLGRLPSPASDAFSFRDEAVSKTELIVFLKPTVVTNPSLDSDELKYFQRFLPSIDPGGRNP
jgi:general secretion pathway protein D